MTSPQAMGLTCPHPAFQADDAARRIGSPAVVGGSMHLRVVVVGCEGREVQATIVQHLPAHTVSAVRIHARSEPLLQPLANRSWVLCPAANTELFKKKRASSELMLDIRSQAINGQYKNFTRIFRDILSRTRSNIAKQTTTCRSPISAQDRLAVTLRYLSTGDSYTSLQYLFRVSKQSIGRIIPDVCAALVQELKGYVELPKTPLARKEIPKTCEIDWNLPHCAGAFDVKHVLLQALVHSGSDLYNYKSNFSTVILALADGNYNFFIRGRGMPRMVVKWRRF
ncbi:hypothetical protein PR048_025363 [Dryococelus australis]|uniref:Transposase n=1 Tax=Dryococelus australis TaxID=614101 RepID=A0ABQ9GR54_9NEOP|nr:hypothetical protein PR048_025363 [Dryococelus australis]